MTKFDRIRKTVDRGDTITRELEEDVLALLDLLHAQHKALAFAADYIPGDVCAYGECDICRAQQAYDEFNKEVAE